MAFRRPRAGTLLHPVVEMPTGGVVQLFKQMVELFILVHFVLPNELSLILDETEPIWLIGVIATIIIQLHLDRGNQLLIEL